MRNLIRGLMREVSIVIGILILARRGRERREYGKGKGKGKGSRVSEIMGKGVVMRLGIWLS